VPKEVTRYISRPVERELWGRAAGRCQFSGCNILLYVSAVTSEAVNLSEKAHIYSFSEKGPRGWGPFKNNLSTINDISNLMLMCHGCHKKIDQDKKGQRYKSELLIRWKASHEGRVKTVTGIESDKKTHVVLYGANIGSEKSPIRYHDCVGALFPKKYPCHEAPKILSMKSELKDSNSAYWRAESEHLYKSYERNIAPLIDQDECKNFSIFALAPQPLLIQLGCLFTEKIDVETYQLHREPKGWSWQDHPADFEFIVNRPMGEVGIPVLLISLSDKVSEGRVSSVLDGLLSVWEVTISRPSNRFLKSQEQLLMFRQVIAQLMVEIKDVHGREPLNIMPVMPVACAIELGRARMPKADMPWVIYDHSIKEQKFIKAIEIAGDCNGNNS